MDWLTTLGLGLGSAWLSGIKLYAAVVTLGLLERFHLARLPGDMHVLSEWWVIGVAGLLFLVEFFVDKVPWLDSTWDAIHTFIRVPAGAVLAASAFAEFSPVVRVIALLAGGGIALTSHGTKATVRLAANTSPEPFSNILLSLAEDATTIGLAAFMVFHPVVMLVLLLAFLAVFLWAAPKIFRGLSSLLDRVRGWFASAPER